VHAFTNLIVFRVTPLHHNFERHVVAEALPISVDGEMLSDGVSDAEK